MARFDYRAYDGEGRLARGAIEAASPAEAAARIAARGLKAFETRPADAKQASPWWRRDLTDSRLSVSVLAETVRELATLVGADLPIDEALDLVVLQLPAGRARAVMERVRRRVTEGSALSEAMAQEGKVFPAFMTGMLRAGEAAGALAGVLEDLAGHLERTAELRSRITSALIYPIVLLALGAIAVSVVLGMLVPALAGIFEDAGGEMPVALSVLVAVREVIVGQWRELLAGALAVSLACLFLLRDQRVRLALSRAVLKVPVLGLIVGEREAASIARTLGILLRSGVPLVSALATSTALLGNRHMRDRLGSVVTGVKEGKGLGRCLAAADVLPPLLLRLVGVGEATGELERMLLHGALVLETRVERRIERMVALLTPALTIVIGLGIGGLVASVMSAMLGMNDMALR